MTTLCYRGIRYDRPDTTLEMTESDILAHYRGNAYHVRYPKHMDIPQPTMLCKYRGIAYRTLADGSIAHVPSAPGNALTPVAVTVAQDELHRVHAQNICSRLNERLAAAKAHGDAQLIAMLERESQELVCPR
jgi:hypothetical protein